MVSCVALEVCYTCLNKRPTSLTRAKFNKLEEEVQEREDFPSVALPFICLCFSMCINTHTAHVDVVSERH